MPIPRSAVVPWWKRRFVAIVLTVALALFTIVAFALVLIGPRLASQAAEWLGLGPSVGMVWVLIRWPAIRGNGYLRCGSFARLQ